jgi:hypothetical protein
MLVLDDIGKQSFLKVLYTVMMQDKEFSQEEANTIELVAKEIFRMGDYEEINLRSCEKTALELSKISSDMVLMSLAEILSYVAMRSSQGGSKTASDEVHEFLRKAFEYSEISYDAKTKILDRLS